MCTEDVNNDSLYAISVNKLHESLAWYTQYLKITLSSDAWIFTKAVLCFYLFLTISIHVIKIFHNEGFHKIMREYGLPVCSQRYTLNHRNMWDRRDLQGFNLLFRVILFLQVAQGHVQPAVTRASVSSLLQCLTTFTATCLSCVSSWNFLHSNWCPFFLVIPLCTAKKDMAQSSLHVLYLVYLNYKSCLRSNLYNYILMLYINIFHLIKRIAYPFWWK